MDLMAGIGVVAAMLALVTPVTPWAQNPWFVGAVWLGVVIYLTVLVVVNTARIMALVGAYPVPATTIVAVYAMLFAAGVFHTYVVPRAQRSLQPPPHEEEPTTQAGPAASAEQVQGTLGGIKESEYRNLVADVIHTMEPNAYVAVGGTVVGPDGVRKIDVQVWPADRQGGPIVIDVIDQPKGSPVSIEAVDLIESKRRDLPVRAALICSNSGFTREAISKAKRTGVGLIAVLKQGDRRASVIEEEVYLRTVELASVRTNYQHGGKSRRVKVFDVTYKGVPVDAWLFQRLMLAMGGLSQDVEGLKLYYRLKQPATFNAPGGKLRNVTEIAVLFDAKIHWASQVAQVNATTAIYDYVRNRTNLGGGTNQYSITVNWDEAIPMMEAPQVEPLGSSKGGVDMALVRVQGIPIFPSISSPSPIDDLVDSDDLKPEFPFLRMKP